MEFKDYYQVLGVTPEADEKAIKAAYRRLARKYHPDVSKEANAEEKFKTANEAYEVLGNAERRAEYDQLRARGYRPGDNYQPPNWGGGGFEGFGESGFSDFFESLFGRARGSRSGAGASSRPAQDVRAHIDIDLELAYAGGKQRVDVNGKTLEIKIPAGIAAGQNIRLKGQGGSGRDLLLEIGYRKHALYELDGRNIILTRKITPWEAALGATIDVPTLAGTVKLSVPPDSGNGRRLRLRGRGMPGSPAAGDQFVVLEIQAPSAKTDMQKRAYRDLAKAFGSEWPD